MKTLTKFYLTLVLIGGIFMSSAHAETIKPTLTVLKIDAKGVQLDPDQMGNLVRLELEKLDTFDVTDRYDVLYLVEKNQLNIANCYGKTCLLEIGNTIKSDFMLTGNIELYGQTIIMTLRLINVQSKSIERTTVQEFLNFPLEIQAMTNIVISKMFGRPVNNELEMRLTRKFDFENAINNPDKNRVSLSGPRFGYTWVLGSQADRLAESRKDGGYDAYPFLFQFGYQFEKQYLNEGNYQALFEFIPMISGVDQQMVIPSVTFLNGFRDNKRGWELAIGPTISIATYQEMAYATINGKSGYYTEPQLRAAGVSGYSLNKTVDSRGEAQLTSALVFAIGKTLKSGRMNIPLNIWFTVPSHDGFRVGFSVGYNSKK